MTKQTMKPRSVREEKTKGRPVVTELESESERETEEEHHWGWERIRVLVPQVHGMEGSGRSNTGVD